MALNKKSAKGIVYMRIATGKNAGRARDGPFERINYSFCRLRQGAQSNTNWPIEANEKSLLQSSNKVQNSPKHHLN
ncbi:MAG TPA: hypothetical protein QGI39_02565, partial [Gammaproteobacteria bacterium]|nr:hypothetical protein [Gammaproteobacteria bacterium]